MLLVVNWIFFLHISGPFDRIIYSDTNSILVFSCIFALGDFFFKSALFKNTQILKFRNQLTFAFFATVNHLNGPLRKQKFSSTHSKGHGLQLIFVIGGFRSIAFLCFKV